jgi:hypothetical protein
VPKTKKNQLVTLNNSRITIPKKLKALDISEYKDAIRTRILVNKDKTLDEIYAKLNALDEQKRDLINDETKYSKNTKNNFEKNLKDFPFLSYEYLNSDYKEILIKHVLLNNIDDKKNMIDVNIIYMKRDYNPTTIANDARQIWGYKIVKNGEMKYYKLIDNNKFELGTSTDNKQINKTTNIRIKQELPANTLIGYIEEKYPEKTMSLKIRDKSQEGAKGTHIKTGSICGNDGMKKGKIIDFVHTALSNTKYNEYNKNKLPGKPSLCNELEIHLRMNNRAKLNNHRWFYTYEEALERGLNKKRK